MQKEVGRSPPWSGRLISWATPTPFSRLPLALGVLFLTYFVLSFVLMASVKTTMPIEIAGHHFDLKAIAVTFFKYSLIGVVIVPAIFLLEIVSVGWIESSARSIFIKRDMSGRSDLVCFLLTHLRLMRVPQIIFTFGFALITGDMVHGLVENYVDLRPAMAALPSYVEYPLCFLLYTMFDYLAHRVDHSRYFWPLHRFHHAAAEFHVFTADRGHPASALTQAGLKIFPLVVIGVPIDAIINIGMLIVAISYLNHSRIDWDFGWFGRYVIQSPRHHQLHHSRLLRHPVNLSVCPIWDRLGGTWRDVVPTKIILGTSVPYRHGAFIVPDLMRDYRDFLMGLLWGGRRLTAQISRFRFRRQPESTTPADRSSSDR